MIKVKICGLTNFKDALFAAENGADYLGFIFYKKSPRYIDLEEADEIISKLPNKIKTVGVFVNQSAKEVNAIASLANLSLIQLHGNESPDFVRKIKKPVIKAFSVKNKESLIDVEKYNVFAYLFDTFSEGLYGGTGETFNLELLGGHEFNKPLFLSGGLTVKNVSEVIKKVKPFAVDVASGVEDNPGEKNHNKIKQFIKAVKLAEKKYH